MAAGRTRRSPHSAFAKQGSVKIRVRGLVNITVAWPTKVTASAPAGGTGTGLGSARRGREIRHAIAVRKKRSDNISRAAEGSSCRPSMARWAWSSSFCRSMSWWLPGVRALVRGFFPGRSAAAASRDPLRVPLAVSFFIKEIRGQRALRACRRHRPGCGPRRGADRACRLRWPRRLACCHWPSAP